MVKRPRQRPYRRERKYRRLSPSTGSSSDSSESFSPTQVAPHVSSTSVNDFDGIFVPLRASSPFRFDSSIESINSTKSNGDSSLSSEDSDDKLFCGSTTTVQNLCDRVLEISTKHSLPDAAVNDFLSLIGDILPAPNKCPTLYKHKKILNEPLSAPVETISSGNGKVFVLPFEDQLFSILKRYPNCESLDVNVRNSNFYADIVTGSLFPHPKPKTVYFILNTDGFSPVLSRRTQVWPLLLSVINLHPKERRKLVNCIMVAFYIGNDSKPDWNVLLDVLTEKLTSTYRYQDQELTCKLVALVADSPAKASCCFIQNMNARFGCCTCLVQGTYNGEVRKMTFPITKNCILRDETSHRRHQTQGTTSNPVNGVKGYSPLSHILRLPTCVPYDIMHLVYLGIARNLLNLILEKRQVESKILSSLISSVQVPHWFRRKPRDLRELALWKSQEHKVFLLYYAPLCFYLLHSRSESTSVTEKQIMTLYLLLSSSVYTLSSDYISQDDILSSKKVIYAFQKCMFISFGPGVLTGSLHALLHLPSQVPKFGSLAATSAATFENVNRFLKRSVTGRVGQGIQIANRFLHMSVSAKAVNLCEIVEVLRLHDPQLTSACKEKLEHFNIPPGTNRFIAKVRVHDHVFHSYLYGRKLSSASYYCVDANLNFRKIICIFVQDDVISCLCRNYKVVMKWSAFTACELPDGVEDHLHSLCPSYLLERSHLQVCNVTEIGTPAIIHKFSFYKFFGVRVINDYDHE